MKRGNTTSGIVGLVKNAWEALSEYPSAGGTGVTRVDGWTNVTTGLGTSRDKTMGGFFAAGCLLDDNQLRNLYTFDDLASKIVDTYPKEEWRLGFGLSGLAPEACEQVDRYLRGFDIVTNCLDSRIWARLFGGAGLWVMVDDGKDPIEELDLAAIKSVLGLRVIERPWLIAYTAYPDGPKVGQPMVYRMQAPNGMGVPATLGYIHETRVIRFPGERTDSLTKAKLRGWDLSCLIKPFEALRSSGETWKAIELLVVDSNQGVYSVSDLFGKIAGDTEQTEPTDANPTGGGAFLKRVQVMDRIKSVFRAIVLDKEEESYERHQTTFTGLSDISDRAWRRVASAADIPVPLLQGENPAGLNNTGTMQLQWFWAKTEQNRTQIDEPALLRLVRILLSAQDAPDIEADDKDEEAADATGDAVDPLDKIGIVWPPLWAPTAAELSKMKLEAAQAAQIWITTQAMLPEEAMLSQPKEWYPAVDREMREASIEADKQTLAEAGKGTKEPEASGHLELAPTDIALVVTVNEARASVGLPALASPEGAPDPDGDLTLAAFQAKAEGDGAAAVEPGPGTPKPPVMIPGTNQPLPGGKLPGKAPDDTQMMPPKTEEKPNAKKDS